MDAAALAIADLLNTHFFFCHNCPTEALCSTLGVAKGTKVLANFVPSTYTGPAIPRMEAECQGIPASIRGARPTGDGSGITASV
jgi:hypothetical protein